MAIITAAELAAYIGIPDSLDDTNLAYATNAATDAVKAYCDRNFDKTPTTAATARVYRTPRPFELDVHDFWDTTVLVVKTDDDQNGVYETTWTLNTDYVVEPLNRLDSAGTDTAYTRLTALGTRWFPNPIWSPTYATVQRPLVQVTAAWGWETIPDDVKQATLIKAHRLFKRKDSPEGVLGGAADFTAVRISHYEDPDVEMLLGPYKRTSVLVA